MRIGPRKEAGSTALPEHRTCRLGRTNSCVGPACGKELQNRRFQVMVNAGARLTPAGDAAVLEGRPVGIPHPPRRNHSAAVRAEFAIPLARTATHAGPSAAGPAAGWFQVMEPRY